jgi:hypothetical protein
VARRVIVEGVSLLHSDRDYDWLGPGSYFWESDPQRAWEWANSRAKQGSITEPAVVGAVIDLRHCLDLVSREDVELLNAAYESFVDLQKKSGLPLPENRAPSTDDEHVLLLRFLDCAVLRHLHRTIEEANDPDLKPFDTVRGMFVEGGEAFPGSGLHRKSHVQIAVRDDDCIKGLFFPLQDGSRLFPDAQAKGPT